MLGILLAPELRAVVHTHGFDANGGAQDDEMMLVMEYMPKGDLYHALLQDTTDSLKWNKRWVGGCSA